MMLLAAVTLPDALTFALAALIVVGGALGVIFMANPIHSALMLVMTLFGVAVLFVEEDAQFLAAVQVIVYAGAIVVLFLFVIMLLGVDRPEAVRADEHRAQRGWAILLGAAALAEVILLAAGHWTTGASSVSGKLSGQGSNVSVLGKALFTTYLLPFEVTSALLVVAVVAAVVLARRPESTHSDIPEVGQGEASELASPTAEGASDPAPGVDVESGVSQ
jgi:NADH-quinone oxidoreductase subunit J